MSAVGNIIGECMDCCICPQASLILIPELSIGVTFSSLTSSNPAIHGYSAYETDDYDPDHPERWTYRLSKWGVRDNYGTIDRKDGKCVDPYFPTGIYTRIKWIVSGADNLSCTYSSTTKTDRYDKDEPPYDTCSDPSVLTYTYTGIDGIPLADEYFNVTTNATSRTWTGKESIPEGNSAAYFGSLVTALNGISGMEGAIACDSSATHGTDQCAKNGYVVSFTIPETDSPIYFGESTSVTQHFSVYGDPSTSYSIKVTYLNSQSDAADETTPNPPLYDLPDTYDYVSVTTDGDGYAEFDLDIPDPEGANSQRCFGGAENNAGSEYYIAFPIPKINGGMCYRVSWIERDVSSPEPIDSIEVYSAGQYRPTVTISASPSGGIQATAIAVMASDGSVDSVQIVNAGTGYSSSPTITIEPSIGGESSATDWTASVSGGKVISISVGSGGDYLPEIVIDHPAGGSPSEATCTMNASGGIASVTVTVGGSAVYEPSISVTPKIGSTPVPADLIAHFESETAKCQKWNGSIPGDYDKADPDTWPRFGPFSISSDIRIVSIRSICDCSECP